VAELKRTLWQQLVRADERARAGASLDALSLGSGGEDGTGADQKGGPSSQPRVTVPFQDVIASIAGDCRAGRLTDLSVHMCFICLLHLANEQGLQVVGAPDLSTLDIARAGA